MKRALLPLLCTSALFVCQLKAEATKSGLDFSGMDKSVRVQDDIYLHMSGEWLKKTEIPADRSNYGSFSALEDLSNDRIRSIIEETAAKPQVKGTAGQRIGDFYRSFMNTERIEALGMKPLEPEIARIQALKDLHDIQLHFAHLVVEGVGVPVEFGVGQDSKDSSKNIAEFWQSGTTLPDRDYYLRDEPKYKEARAAFVVYVRTLLGFAGYEDVEAQRQAEAILALETAFATAQRTKVALRDPEANYNKVELAKLNDITPDFPWTDFLKIVGADAVTYVNVGQPDFVKAATATIGSTPVATLKAYMVFNLVDARSSVLPERVVNAAFEFHSRTLAGVPAQKPRWKRAVNLIAGEGAGSFGALGEDAGKLYVARYFTPEAKQRMDTLVHNLMLAYDKSISDLSWMTPETKARAREKLSKYMVKIGYTDSWRDYSSMSISADDLYGNILASNAWSHQRMLQKLTKGPDRKEWHMTPQTVNAYYNPGMNEIVFPAAILQPPFFNIEADDAVNYGGIGAVIGHEISHGFDDKGSQYDGDGNLRNWWSEDDSKAFKELTNRLVAQYNACEALPGKTVNGQLTLGENIADLSGLAIAYKAYHLSLNGKEAPVIDGLTGDQRFFFGWAQVWRRKYRDAEMVKRLLTDPHSPSQFRAIVPLTNSDAFIKAFDVKPGDKLYKPEAERIRIW